MIALDISPLVLGTMTFGDTVDASGAAKMVDAALDAGITHIDTANGYAGGESERILADLLATRRDRVTLATKAGMPHPDADGNSPLSPKGLRLSVDASLSRLGTDYVDLFYLHQPDRATPLSDTLVTVAELVSEGKIRALGVSNFAAWQIADKLSQSDADHANDYKANASKFADQADTIAVAEWAIGSAHPGSSVVATEPVAHYLLVNSGITDKTPEGFASAVEQDTDPSPADLAAMLDLINTHQVSALLFNPQTETAATKQIEDAARQSSLPVAEVTETLPQGMDYLNWQRHTVDELASQLDKAPQTNR